MTTDGTEGSTSWRADGVTPGSEERSEDEKEATSYYALTNPMTAADLEDSANKWLAVGMVLLLLAFAGSIALGVVLCPTKASSGYYGYGPSTEKDVGAGFGIGVGAFVGSLVVILPYFMFSRVMRALATLLPPTVAVAATPKKSAPRRDGL